MTASRPHSLNRWLIPIISTALLLGVLLFLFPYKFGRFLKQPASGICALGNLDRHRDGHAGSFVLPPRSADAGLHSLREAVATGADPGAQRQPRDRRRDRRLLLFWIGSRAGKQYIGCAGIQLLILGLVFWFWGGSLFRKLLFAWAILAFAWPLPFLDTTVAFPLRMIVSSAAYYTLNFVGIPTLQDGTALYSAPAATFPWHAVFRSTLPTRAAAFTRCCPC